MLPKPPHLGPQYAAQFKDASVVAAYHHRPPYPWELFEVLLSLIVGKARVVLDIGCGSGEIARWLAPHVERVDAVDFSPAMIEKGKRLPGGDHANIRWTCGAVEEVDLDPPYGLVSAGASLHWMEWSVALRRLREALTPAGYLAIVGEMVLPTPWDDRLLELISEYSTNRDYEPFNLVDELERRGLFAKVGEHRTAMTPFSQPLDGYIESFHARNGLSRQRMGVKRASAFDTRVRELVLPHCPDGVVRLQVGAIVEWGRPVIT